MTTSALRLDLHLPRAVLSAVADRRSLAIGRSGVTGWLLTFVAVNALLLAVVVATLWAFGGFSGPGIAGHLLVALCLGVTFTSALGVALMALVFYSARADYDEGAFRAGRGGQE